MSPTRQAGAVVRPSLWGKTPGRRVPVYIGSGLIENLPKIIGKHHTDRTCEIVTDKNVDVVCGKRLMNAFRQAGWHLHKTVLGPGERVKSAATITALHDAWFSRGYDRHTVIIALGGGTIGDAAGFAAATFLRGLPLWQVPTTIIGQVDASVGGKVGINHRRGKNLIGCFYQPSGIISDVGVLGSLPERERRSGLAEVVKYGVIADERLFHQCERSVGSWLSGQPSLPLSVLKTCVRLKLGFVEADEADRGVRHYLNFGHTIGHALERWGRYDRLRHGEAVAIGMVAAGWIARGRGILSTGEFDRLEFVCSQLYPTRRLPDFALPDVTQHLKLDKKRRAGHIRWVLPHALGKVSIHDDVTTREVNGALRYATAPLRR